MQSFHKVIFFPRLDSAGRLFGLLLITLALTCAFSGQVVRAQSNSGGTGSTGGTGGTGDGANAVSQLSSVFGDPATFVANFQATVKDKSDQLVGLLIAAGGFVYAVRVFY